MTIKQKKNAYMCLLSILERWEIIARDVQFYTHVHRFVSTRAVLKSGSPWCQTTYNVLNLEHKGHDGVSNTYIIYTYNF